MVTRHCICSSLLAASLAVLGCSEEKPNTSGQAPGGQAPGASEAKAEEPESSLSSSGAAPNQYLQVVEILRRHSLPAIRITPSRLPPKTPWQSRFGGVPYWPRGTPLPTSGDGSPLFLLAQINFSEAPHMPGYPTEGILQVFIADDELYGFEFESDERPQEQINKNPRGHNVIYHATIEQDASRLLSEAPSPESFPVGGSYSLTFQKVQDPLAIDDYRFEKLVDRGDELSDDLLDQLSEDFSGTGSKLGGYAFFTQTDPRAMQTSAGEWLLLLQIDTHEADGIDIEWGDAGVGNLFIRPQDLARRDFSNVWYNWDCY